MDKISSCQLFTSVREKFWCRVFGDIGERPQFTLHDPMDTPTTPGRGCLRRHPACRRPIQVLSLFPAKRRLFHHIPHVTTITQINKSQKAEPCGQPQDRPYPSLPGESNNSITISRETPHVKHPRAPPLDPCQQIRYPTLPLQNSGGHNNPEFERSDIRDSGGRPSNPRVK